MASLIPPELTTERLLLDQPRESDLELITQHCQDPLFEQFLFTPWPYTHDDAEYFLNQVVRKGWQNGEELTWALRLRNDPNQALLGVLGFRVRSEELLNIGFWLGSAHRGHGYLPEAALGAVKWIQENLAQYRILEWDCAAENFASKRVAEKIGFSNFQLGEARQYRPEHVIDGIIPQAWHGTLELRAD